MYKNSIGVFQSRLGVVEAKQSTKMLPTYDRSGPVEVGRWHDDLAAQALMVSLLMVVGR
jgi:hypothetical protein